ncbi:band 7 protein [mine drainage metagenome]|uniref:Band 7 protein n=1 Tax=mine drainage metagenome TaxID=410659 RepID=T1CLJ7_9ZZZZ
MALTRQVISTLKDDGTDIMGPDILGFHYPDASIVSGSLLTVEANHFAVLKSRGAVLAVYDTGQYPVQTPDKPLLGGFCHRFLRWQFAVAVRGVVRQSRQVAGTQYRRGDLGRDGRDDLHCGLLHPRGQQG